MCVCMHVCVYVGGREGMIRGDGKMKALKCPSSVKTKRLTRLYLLGRFSFNTSFASRATIMHLLPCALGSKAGVH